MADALTRLGISVAADGDYNWGDITGGVNSVNMALQTISSRGMWTGVDNPGTYSISGLLTFTGSGGVSGNLVVSGSISAANNWQTPQASTVSGIASGTPTTIFSPPATQAMYNIYVYLDGGYAASQAYISGILMTDGFGGISIGETKTASTCSFVISGSNLQVNQTTGTVRTAIVRIQRVM